MKSVRVAIIFYFLCSFCFAIPEGKDIYYALHQKKVLDSIYFPEIPSELTKASAKKAIDTYTYLKSVGVELTNEDFKKLAICYAIMDDSKSASKCLDYYIRNSFDINILYSNKFNSINAANSFQKLKKTYLPKFNFWIVFFIFSGIIGVFISIMINIRKKGDRVANFLIGLFVLFHSLFILHLSLYLTNYTYQLPHSLWITITFSFLYGPLIYFYFKRITEEYGFKKIDILHFLPTLILILWFIPIYSLPAEEKQYRIFNVNETYVVTLYTVLILKSISLVSYSVLVLKIYRKCVLVKQRFLEEVIQWKRNMSYLNVLYAVTYTIYAVVIANNVVFDRSKSVMLYSQVFVLAIVVLYIAYTVYAHPNILIKKYLLGNNENHHFKKYEKSGLTKNFSYELKEQLLKLLNEEKIYKDNNINLNSLSDKMGVTRHNLSQVINEHFGMNFFNLINKYRISEAQQILINDTNKNLNIIDIAYDVGFNNKVTFNKAFKEATKLTPTQYIQKLKTTSLQVNNR